MNLTLSILTIIAVLFIVSLTYKFFYKSKQIKKIKNSSSSIGYTYNRSKYSNNSDYSLWHENGRGRSLLRCLRTLLHRYISD